MIINSKLESYLDLHAHAACMVRNMFYQYSRAECSGDYVFGMYAQMLMYLAQDELREMFKQMSNEEQSSCVDWLFL